MGRAWQVYHQVGWSRFPRPDFSVVTCARDFIYSGQLRLADRARYYTNSSMILVDVKHVISDFKGMTWIVMRVYGVLCEGDVMQRYIQRKRP
jgi:hypothetical protein